jgi:hypothetical protein
MTPYAVTWTDLQTGTQHATTIHVARHATARPELFITLIAFADLGGARDQHRVRIDSYEVKA